MEFVIFIDSSDAPEIKWNVEDYLEDWLGEKGEIVGGGAATDGSRSHITIEVFDRGMKQMPSFLAQFRLILQSLHVPQNTSIVVEYGNDSFQEFPVYGTAQE